MGKTESLKLVLVVMLGSSLTLNFFFIFRVFVGDQLNWSRRAAAEAEEVAAISCSGHGRVYLDGLRVGADKPPIYECNACFVGPDCSQTLPDCVADADSGNPLFLEPFWTRNAESSAVLTAGWHRLDYSFSDGSFISEELEKHIRQVHDIVGNAVTQGRYIIFGVGSTHLLNAAVHALSAQNSSSPAKVVASIPYYPIYKQQTEYFRAVDFNFGGDVSLWRNNSDDNTNLIEFVNSPYNPDGQLKEAVLRSPNVEHVYDRVYYWPYFTAISAQADNDIMLFSISKLTGHAGSRFGWAVVKDENIFQRMSTYMRLSTLGVSRDTQLRALQLIKVVLKDGGKEIFDYGYRTLSNRWEKLNETLSTSTRFTLQETEAQYCNYFHKIRGPSPAYAWLKCEREEDKDCYAVLEAAKILGRRGSLFGAEERYVRLSLLKTQDDFDILVYRLKILISEGSAKPIAEM